MSTKNDTSASDLVKSWKDKIEVYSEKIKTLENAIKTVEETLKSEGDEIVSKNKVQDNKYSNKKLDVPNEFSKHFSQDEKIYFALRRIREGFVPDVADELVRLDDSFDKIKAKKLATDKLSKLRGLGFINYTPVGNKYKYSI